MRAKRGETILGERRSDEDRGESSDSTDERSFPGVEEFVSDIGVILVSAAVDNDTEDDEDLWSN